MKLFTFLFLICLLVSCSKNVPEEHQLNTTLCEHEELPEHYLNSYGEMLTYFYQTYDIEVLCACDCNTSEIVQSDINLYWNDYYEDLPFSPTNFTCEVMQDNWFFTCNKSYDIVKPRLIDVLDDMIELNLISSQEKDFILSFINELHSGSIRTQEEYLNDFDQLDLDLSRGCGAFTKAMINLSFLSVETFSNFVPSTEDGTIEDNAIIHKALGVVFGVSTGVVYEEVFSDGINSEKEYWTIVLWGSATGALGSL